MKKFKRFSLYFFSFIFVLLIATTIFMFTSETGYKLRLVAAEVILSSQHRELAKFTFLPEDVLQKIQDSISNPDYLNSHDTSLSNKILDSIKDGDSTKNSTDKLKDLYVSMVDQRKTKEQISKEDQAALDKIKREKELAKMNEGKLIIHVDNIKGSHSDHFYEGKIMSISNPSNVRLVSSKGQQVNSEYGEQINIIAKRENAIGAINASGFLDANGTGNGGTPIGIVIENGKITNTPGGKKAKAYVAGLTKKGLLITGYYNSNELVELDVEYAAGFKPQLIVNGEKMITDGNGGWGYGPRTAVGQKADGTILFLVIDGRQTHSIGASMKDVQDILFEKGAVNAMAMDGGSSAILHFNGNNVTSPSSVGGVPRYIPNAWVVSPTSKQQVEIYQNGSLLNKYTNN